MELQPGVYDYGDFGRETSHGIADEYVLVRNKNKLMKFVKYFRIPSFQIPKKFLHIYC